MLKKAFIFAMALFSLMGISTVTRAQAESGCCKPGAACCAPGAPCCAPGAHCCAPGAACCEAGGACCG